MILRKVICPDCGKPAAVKANGRFRDHGYELVHASINGKLIKLPGASCAGVGKFPPGEEEP